MSVFDPKICQEGHTDKLQCLESSLSQSQAEVKELEERLRISDQWRKELENKMPSGSIGVHPRDLKKLEAEVKRLMTELEKANFVCNEALDHSDSWKLQAEKMAEALKEISEGKGAYSQDQFEHCRNTVRDMKELAVEATKSYEAFVGGEGKDNANKS